MYVHTYIYIYIILARVSKCAQNTSDLLERCWRSTRSPTSWLESRLCGAGLGGKLFSTEIALGCCNWFHDRCAMLLCQWEIRHILTGFQEASFRKLTLRPWHPWSGHLNILATSLICIDTWSPWPKFGSFATGSLLVGNAIGCSPPALRHGLSVGLCVFANLTGLWPRLFERKGAARPFSH